MASFTKELSFRWSDLDPNFHVRHSAYYDFGAQHRIEILESLGLTMKVMQAQGFGPILFREECVFRKEIKLADKIVMHTKSSKVNDDASRWSIIHEFRNEADQVCATITVDGAWMDLKLRKLALPTPEIAKEALLIFPKSDGFTAV